MIRFTPLAMIACVPHLNTEHPVEPVGEWTAPENSWATSPPPAGLEGEGFDVGDIVVDVRLPDQFDDEVSVWQFFGHLVVLDVSTMWCAPCRELAETTQHTVDTYGDALQYVTVLQEDPDGDPPTTEDLGSWANVYGLSTPVLGDGTYEGTGAAIDNGQYPALLLIDTELHVVERINPPTDAQLVAAIEEHL
ncbi:MAG: redoxin domain-containing protein [Myxococcales bacterium]|nr:redoxin domain-containing protein [Myxococcales bacterium]